MAKKLTYEELAQRIKELEKEVADHKKAKEALKETEQKYQNLSESLLDTVYEFDREGRFTYVNEAGTHMFGYSKEEILNGLRVQDTIYENERDLSKGAISAIFEGNTTVGERTFLRKDGTKFIGEIHSGPIYKGEMVVGVRGVLRDITTSKQAEEALRESEKKYRDLIENINDVIYHINENGVITYISPTIESVSGYSPSEIIGKSLTEFIYEEDLPRIKKRFNEILSGKIEPSEYRLLNKSGEIRWIYASSKPVYRENQVIGIQGVMTDITERKRADDILHREKEKFRVLVEEFPLGVLLIGHDGSHKYINPKFIEIFGYTLEDIPNRREWFRKAYPDQQYRNKVISTWTSDLKRIEIGEPQSQIVTVMCRDGSEKLINVKAVIFETGEKLVVYEDITEKNRLEAQLQQAQKVEAIGTLAGGIAHNFNNLLMSVLGNTSLMLLDTPPYHPHYERLTNIEKSVQSGSKFTSQLLGYAQGGSYEKKQININNIITKTSATFAMTRKDITLHNELANNLSSVKADWGHIEQVILNIFANAAEAMLRGGELFIATRNISHTEIEKKTYTIKPGNYVLVTIRDTGTGMDKETQEKIFDPFFTTKGLANGTGLSLASVYGIIKAHAGYIDVSSQKGKGTTFFLYLPASTETIGEGVQPAATIEKGKETILLVDDEKVILDVGKGLLTYLGYTVITASSGKEAIETLLTTLPSSPPDIVILDMIMPQMGGGETYDKMKELHPTIKVLLSSGYSIDGQATEILERGCNGFIQKPFSIKELSKAIREVVERA